MRIKFSRHHPGDKDEVPSFLRHEIDSGQYERTGGFNNYEVVTGFHPEPFNKPPPRPCSPGFYHDFPVFADNPEVATKLGYLGRTYHTENMEIIHFFNRSKGDMVGSVIFSLDCEGPPGGNKLAFEDVKSTIRRFSCVIGRDGGCYYVFLGLRGK
ncbi:unnamed protein product [Choristocarpus tenellus]